MPVSPNEISDDAGEFAQAVKPARVAAPAVAVPHFLNLYDGYGAYTIMHE